jgi:hypothetical protein
MVIEIQGAFGRAQDNSDHTAAGAASEWSAIYSDPPPPHPSHDFAPPPYFAKTHAVPRSFLPGAPVRMPPSPPDYSLQPCNFSQSPPDAETWWSKLFCGCLRPVYD